MNYFKGTPGPWKAIFFSSATPAINQVNDHGDGIKTIVLQCYDNEPPSGIIQFGDEQKANAKLIAAAPDLLEACECFIKIRSLIEYAEKDFESDKYQGEAQAVFVALLKADVAIKKALG